MAEEIKDIKKRYPLPVYNFRVEVLSTSTLITGALSKTGVSKPGIQSARFSDVTGFDLSFTPVVYRDGFSFLTGPTILTGKEEEVKLTLKRGIVPKDSFFYDWLSETRSLLKSGKRDLHISLCDENGVGVVHWNVRGAMPTKLSGPVFNAQSQEIAIESLELTAASLRMEFSS